MAEIVRLRNINVESDIFSYLIEKLEKNSMAKPIFQKAWDFIAMGKKKTGAQAIQGLSEKYVKKVFDNLVEYVLDEVDPLMLVGDSNFPRMVAKVLSHGIVNELVEDPLRYKKFLLKEQVDEASEVIVERGKAKFLNMLERGGIREGSMDNNKIAKELVKIAKDLVSVADYSKLNKSKVTNLPESMATKILRSWDKVADALANGYEFEMARFSDESKKLDKVKGLDKLDMLRLDQANVYVVKGKGKRKRELDDELKKIERESDWVNDSEIYYESGYNAGRASKNRDQGMVNHEQRWMQKAVRLEGDNESEARKIWNDGYKKGAKRG